MKMFISDWNYLKKSWTEIGDDPEKAILDYFYENVQIYDADNCGEEGIEFAFKDDNKITYYKLYYEWWFEYCDEDEATRLRDRWVIYQIFEPEFKFPTERDWLGV